MIHDHGTSQNARYDMENILHFLMIYANGTLGYGAVEVDRTITKIYIILYWYSAQKRYRIDIS